MAGHEVARCNLGVIEARSGNLEQAVKHWTIGASAGEHQCVYFTFLHLVSYLTINLQFGREATESHSDQKLVIFENGQAF